MSTLPNKITAATIEDQIKATEYYVWPGTTLTLALIKLENGFNVLGQSACIDPNEFDAETGRRLARNDAFEKIWQLEAYLLVEAKYQEKQAEEQQAKEQQAKEPKFKTDDFCVFEMIDRAIKALDEAKANAMKALDEAKAKRVAEATECINEEAKPTTWHEPINTGWKEAKPTTGHEPINTGWRSEVLCLTSGNNGELGTVYAKGDTLIFKPLFYRQSRVMTTAPTPLPAKPMMMYVGASTFGPVIRVKDYPYVYAVNKGQWMMGAVL